MKGNVELPSLGKRKDDRNPPSSHGAERWEEGGGWDVSLEGTVAVSGELGRRERGWIRSRSSIAIFPGSGESETVSCPTAGVGCRCPRLPRKVVLRCLETQTRCADTYPAADQFGSIWKQILSLERLLHLLTICSSSALVSKTVLLYFISSVCLFCLYLFCLSSFCCLCSGQVLLI